MAEICIECLAKICKEKSIKRKYVLSKEEDLCEDCGEWKRVVVRSRGLMPFIRCKIVARRIKKTQLKNFQKNTCK